MHPFILLLSDNVLSGEFGQERPWMFPAMLCKGRMHKRIWSMQIGLIEKAEIRSRHQQDLV